MIYRFLPYTIFPLGDSAITIDFGNCIDEIVNKQVIARFRQLEQIPLRGMTEAVPAYSSLTIYYDIAAVKKMAPLMAAAFDWMKKQTEEWLQHPPPADQEKERKVKIPVCYDTEFATDIQEVANLKAVSIEELIQLHESREYRVYMLGFLPGFAYMGEVDEKIVMPRKPQPVNIAAGSVGIAGKQTGIYPLASPGGWQIIGRTPLKLFKAPPPQESPKESIRTLRTNLPPAGGETSEESFCLLQPGDKVQFYSITKDEFDNF